jgi:serine/threonine protein phosphatase 1
MKTFVVGDIHGRCAQFLNLLDMLPRDPKSDTLVFLGDLIDRGADAPGCVDHVVKIPSESSAFAEITSRCCWTFSTGNPRSG